MKADHAAQLRLLDLQAQDTALAQLAHKRRTLPQLAALVERDARATALGNDLLDAEVRAQDVADEQKRLETEVDAVRGRAARDEARMQSGGLPGKELEGLQHEVATLARRQGSLEDDLLEVMEQQETIDATVTELRGRRDVLEGEIAALRAERDSAFAEIDALLATRTEQRAGIATEIPDDLLALYERAREQGGGSGAAILRQRRCEGCRIELSGSELSRVRNAEADEVVRCDNCRRILVRTAESGL